MRGTITRVSPGRWFSAAACAVFLMFMAAYARPHLKAQSSPTSSTIPDLAGIWDGGTRVRPANSPEVPWAKAGQRLGKPLPDGTIGNQNTIATFPELNERALAYMKAFDEPLSPKYDCQPATPPAIEYDYIPSSQEKKITERYWRKGNELKATITVEDPMFLRKPASFTTRWLPAPKGYTLQAFECDPETARISVQYIPPKYK